MEWKILYGDKADVQKTLNQWRHQYHIHIHGYAVDNKEVSVLLTRDAKEGGH